MVHLASCILVVAAAFTVSQAAPYRGYRYNEVDEYDDEYYSVHRHDSYATPRHPRPHRNYGHHYNSDDDDFYPHGLLRWVEKHNPGNPQNIQYIQDQSQMKVDKAQLDLENAQNGAANIGGPPPS